MIPYFETPPVQIRPVGIHVFRLLVIAAILVGRWIVACRARKLNLDRQAVAELCVWMLVAGFIGAHFGRMLIPQNPRPITCLVGLFGWAVARYTARGAATASIVPFRSS